MDIPTQPSPLPPPAQLRLLLFSLWALYYITHNARQPRNEIQLRTYIRLLIITLAGLLMLFLDARPPSRAHSIRQSLFESVGMIIRPALKPAPWHSAFTRIKRIVEQSLHIAYTHLSLFINTNNDLQPYLNTRIRPFVTSYIKPVLHILAHHTWRDIQNIVYWSGSADFLNSILGGLEGGALYTVTEWIYTQTTQLGYFWTSILLLSITAFVILASRLLLQRIWRGGVEVYTIILKPKSIIPRAWGWLAIVGVVVGGLWRIVVVKGEQHFGDMGDL